jgi:hypothetical protein
MQQSPKRRAIIVDQNETPPENIWSLWANFRFPDVQVFPAISQIQYSKGRSVEWIQSY